MPTLLLRLRRQGSFMKKILGLCLVMLSFVFAQDDMNQEVMMMVEKHAWATVPLVDAVSGNTFKIADFAGKNIYVETFATWCSNCQKQLKEVQAVASKMSEDVFIALSLEGADINNEALKAYAEKNGFTFIVAAVTPEVLESLVADFGNGVTNPPSTPHFFISTKGEVGELLTGIESADKLAEHFSMMGN
jgi:thiol-disulfide isomerase/thioredoxin